MNWRNWFSPSPSGGDNKPPQSYEPGDRYEGPSCYCHDYAMVERPGYYALTEDGQQLQDPLLRLVMIDDAPGDAENPACHLEVASDTDPPMKQGPIVPLHARAQGSSSVGIAP